MSTVLDDGLLARHDPFEFKFNQVANKLERPAKEFVFHDSFKQQQEQHGFRVTTAVLVLDDGQYTADVSVCSDRDSFERKAGRRNACAAVRARARNNIFNGKLDLTNIGTLIKDGEAGPFGYKLVVPREKVNAFMNPIRVAAANAKSRAMVQVFFNRHALKTRNGTRPLPLATVMGRSTLA